MPTVSELYATAVRHQQSGRLVEAESIYRHILAYAPNHAETWHQLGVATRQLGNSQAGIECFQRALAIKPDWAEALCNLGDVLQDQGKLEEAAISYRRAVELKPNFAIAHNNLGNVWKNQGKLVEAITCFRRAVQISPEAAEVHFNLANTLQALGNLEEATTSFQRAVQLKPTFTAAHNNLGNTLRSQGKLDEAAECFQRAVQLEPGLAEAHNNLGAIWTARGRPDEAAECFQRAVQFKPDLAEAHNNLGAIWTARGRPDEAVVCCRRAIQLQPGYAEAYFNLGLARFNQGLQEEAIACYRRAIERKPDYPDAQSTLLYTLHFCPEYDAEAIYEEHRCWNKAYAQPLAQRVQPLANDRATGRRLRIGYVSPDFRMHPIGRFILPLLKAHDHSRFEIICYSSVASPDKVTERCRKQADVWQNVAGLSDEQLAETIRRDGIDVLVDLTMHMAGSRLLTFARKPAPVQMSYLAYCSTTGLETVDYRLTDPYLDPSDQDDSCYSECSVRLPETYWCYELPEEAPAITPLPAGNAGYITFGCFNNFGKVTPQTLTAWAHILKSLPDSRLLLHSLEGSHRDRVRNELARHGISPDRLSFVGGLQTAEYFRLYERIDVALDPFPYGGGTTTCDALVMGVPVISLAGKTGVGRGGLSILSNVGLPELVAKDVEEYVRIAVELARNLPRLKELREELRDRMQASPLMNGPRFARHVEQAYHRAWKIYSSDR